MQVMERKTEPCPGGCICTDEAHIAFDAGLAAGNAGLGTSANPYNPQTQWSLREDWLTGQAVGRNNWEADNGAADDD